MTTYDHIQLAKAINMVAGIRAELEKKIDYEFKMNYWDEFTLLETLGGITGILYTFEKEYEESKKDVRSLTELVLVLNLKIWEWYEKDDNIGRTYDALWKKADGYAMETLKDDDLHYYLSTLD